MCLIWKRAVMNVIKDLQMGKHVPGYLSEL